MNRKPRSWRAVVRGRLFWIFCFGFYCGKIPITWIWHYNHHSAQLRVQHIHSTGYLPPTPALCSSFRTQVLYPVTLTLCAIFCLYSHDPSRDPYCFQDWLLPPGQMSSGLIHAIECGRIFFLNIDYFIVYMKHTFVIPIFVDIWGE